MDSRAGAHATTRIGAVALPLGIAVILVSEFFHPAREDPMDNPAVFTEYAHSNIWTAFHLAQYFGFLLLLGGLVALYYSVSAKSGLGAELAPFGLAAAVTNGGPLHGPARRGRHCLKAGGGCLGERSRRPAESAAFAAAEALRWIEIAMHSLSFFLAGLILFLYGLTIALGAAYPRWTGLIAVVSGTALMYDGAVVVAYEGFAPSIVKLAGILLLAVWAFVMAFLMWRNGGRSAGPIGPTISYRIVVNAGSSPRMTDVIATASGAPTPAAWRTAHPPRG